MTSFLSNNSWPSRISLIPNFFFYLTTVQIWVQMNTNRKTTEIEKLTTSYDSFTATGIPSIKDKGLPSAYRLVEAAAIWKKNNKPHLTRNHARFSWLLRRVCINRKLANFSGLNSANFLPFLSLGKYYFVSPQKTLKWNKPYPFWFDNKKGQSSQSSRGF